MLHLYRRVANWGGGIDVVNYSHAMARRLLEAGENSAPVIRGANPFLVCSARFPCSFLHPRPIHLLVVYNDVTNGGRAAWAGDAASFEKAARRPRRTLMPRTRLQSARRSKERARRAAVAARMADPAAKIGRF